MSKSIPNIIVTPGEPAGCGPDILIALVQKPLPYAFTVIADPDLLMSRAKQLGLPLSIELVDDLNIENKTAISCLKVLPVKCQKPVHPGKLCVENSKYVLNTIDKAIEICLQNPKTVYITGPVHKAILNEAGFRFHGHTHYLANKTKSENVVMFFASEKLQIALVTDHLPLKEVSKHITKERLSSVIEIIHQSLKPSSIIVCGLNPHAGEGGYLGSEEIEVITPVLQKLRDEGITIIGPISADTAFTYNKITNNDVVIGMYHDQVLPILKHVSFGASVNITLGLPFLRTSVDHGTALDLAGTGKADSSSLNYVFHKTIELFHAFQTT